MLRRHFLCLKNKAAESLSDAIFKSGFRTRRRATFLCSAKEKYPKEKPPFAAGLLRADFFIGGRQTGLPAPLPTRGIHASPLRANPDENAGARCVKRDKTRYCVTSVIIF